MECQKSGMTRNPLLPEDYPDSATQASILFALSPYKISERNDISNPVLKWNLPRAWKNAEESFLLARWKKIGADEISEGGYTLSANSEAEIEQLNAIIAGIVAYQILEPESEVAFRRLVHKKGGEVSLVISLEVLEKLKKLIPALSFSNHHENQQKSWWWNLWSFFTRRQNKK